MKKKSLKQFQEEKNYFAPNYFHYYMALAREGQSRKNLNHLPGFARNASVIEKEWELACLRAGLVGRATAQDATPHPPRLLHIHHDRIVAQNLGFAPGQVMRLLPKLNHSLKRPLSHAVVDKASGHLILYRALRELPEMLSPARLPRRPGEPVLGLAQAGWIVQDFKEAPHVLIAGTTGSGKSMFMAYLVREYLRAFARAQATIISPKGLEDYARYLHHPAVQVFAEGFDERLRALEELRERRQQDTALARTPVFIFIDEFQMALTAENVRLVEKLATTGRSANFHLIMASPRPTISDSMLTGQIRGVLGFRVCFRVNEERDSRIMVGSTIAHAHNMPPCPGRAFATNGAEVHELQTPLLE